MSCPVDTPPPWAYKVRREHDVGLALLLSRDGKGDLPALADPTSFVGKRRPGETNLPGPFSFTCPEGDGVPDLLGSARPAAAGAGTVLRGRWYPPTPAAAHRRAPAARRAVRQGRAPQPFG